jgi:predicted Fe-Mo cluster-binding NifX family protein
MKVAITAGGEDLDSLVDRTFGRARWFVITDPDSMQIESHSNRQSVDAAQGAGIQTARQMVNWAVDVVLTGHVGPNAFRALEAASIRIFQFGNEIRTVRDALEAWRGGHLQELTAPTVRGHGF